MFIFAVDFVHVTKKIAMRTLHIRAEPLDMSLLAAMSAFVVWTSAISMRTVAKVPARFAHRNIAAVKCYLSIVAVIVVVVIINIAIGIVVIITHVVVGLTVNSSVELIAFVIAIVGMPIAVCSHGHIALTMVILELMLTADHSLLELGCLTCARRVPDGVALLTHMKQTVGTLLSMTNYLAELAEIRAVLGAMIVTTMSADHMHRLCKDISAFSKSFSLLLVSFRFAGPCQPARLSGCDPHCWMCTVRLVLSSGVRTCVRAWCSLLAFVRA